MRGGVDGSESNSQTVRVCVLTSHVFIHALKLGEVCLALGELDVGINGMLVRGKCREGPSRALGSCVAAIFQPHLQNNKLGVNNLNFSYLDFKKITL
jgi:hypothetical protein